MSDRVIHPSNDKGKQPMHTYQSQPESDGSGGNCNRAVQVQTQLSLGFAQQHSEVEAAGFKLLDNSQAKGSRTRNEIHGRAGSIDSLTLNLSHGSGGDSMLKHEMQVSNIQPTQNNGRATRSDTLLSLAPPSAETSYTDSHIKHQSVSQYPQGPANSQMVFGNGFAFLPPNFGGTTSHNLPQTFHSGNIAAPSYLCSTQGNVNYVTSIMSSERKLLDAKIMTVLEHEKCHNQNQSQFVAHAKYIGNPIWRNHHPAAFYGGHYRAMHNHYDNFFVSNHHPPALTAEQHKTMLSHSGISMSQSRDAFMMRLRTSVENFEPSLIANNVFTSNHHPPAFSEEQNKRMHDSNACSSAKSHACTSTKRNRTCAEKTRTLRTKKSTDSKENPNSRGPKVLSTVKKNSPTKCYSFPQLISHSSKGVDLQVISSSDSEGKDDVQEIKATEVASKKKSPAKRDGMDKNEIKRNRLCGVGSSSPKKNAIADTHIPNKDAIYNIPNLQNAIADTHMNKDAIPSVGEEVGQKRKHTNPEIPDMNVELSANRDDASGVDNPDPNPSRARSLDMGIFHRRDHYGYASSRWIKRLKISESGNKSIGTKSLSLGDATSSEKVNQIGVKAKEGEIISSTQVPLSTSKELMVLDQQTTLIRTGDPSTSNNLDKSDVTAGSHMWTGRWRPNPAKTPEKKAKTPEEKPKAVVVADPQRVKVKLAKDNEKPFASVGAMALMWKAMSGLHKCQFINKGALTSFMDKKA